MKKIKKILPTFCYAILLLSIVFLSFLIIGKSGDPASSAEETVSESVATPIDEIPYEPESIIKTIYTDIFPRESEDGKLKIYGEGNIRLWDVFQVPLGRFLIVSSDCAVGDVATENPCYAIIKTDENNNAKDVYVFGYEREFITARPTVNGFVVLLKNTDSGLAFVHVINYDLSDQNVYKVSVAPSYAIAPKENGFLLFASYDDETYVYGLVDDNLLLLKTDCSRLVDYFDYGDCFLLFTNQSDGFYAVSINKNDLSIGSKTKMSDSELQYIVPVYSDKGYFIAVEKGDNLSVKKYDAQSGELLAQKELSESAVSQCYRLNNCFFLQSEENNKVIRITDELIVDEFGIAEDTILLDVIDNEEYDFLIKDASGNLLRNGEILDAATNVILLPCVDSYTLLTEKETEDGYYYIEIRPID